MMNEQPKMDMAPINGRIRELGMTQSDFAKKDGRSLVQVRKILTGESRMSWDTIMTWSSILNAEVGSPDWYHLFFTTKS